MDCLKKEIYRMLYNRLPTIIMKLQKVISISLNINRENKKSNSKFFNAYYDI